ncbi:MAG: DUF5996 family protein, partial [Conexibacter sp.]
AAYDPHAVTQYFRAAAHAALALAAIRAEHAGRATPVNAWWGSFDLAVSLFAPIAGERDAPERELAVGWWPGDPRSAHAAFYAYAKPAPDGFAQARVDPPQARWEPALGELLLDHDAVAAAPDPQAAAQAFARSALMNAGVSPVR